MKKVFKIISLLFLSFSLGMPTTIYAGSDVQPDVVTEKADAPIGAQIGLEDVAKDKIRTGFVKPLASPQT